MNHDDIIRMARQVADPDTTDPLCGGDYRDLITLNLDEMVRFAALVAAAAKAEERESILGVVKAMHDRESRGPEHPVKRWQDAFGWNMTRKDAVSDVLHHIRARGGK